MLATKVRETPPLGNFLQPTDRPGRAKTRDGKCYSGSEFRDRNRPDPCGSKTADVAKGAAKPGGRDRKQSKAAFDKPAGAPTQQNSLPKAGSGAKTYTVQVGAFTHPAIAQQWAEKWKLRGYDVSLKPVARPKSGVIYRLYLGNFSSEKKADEPG